jgi:hypothetical protein
LPKSLQIRAFVRGVAFGDFPEKAVLFLWISDFCAHLSQSHWIPAKGSSKESNFPVVVLFVVLLTKPNDLERIPVILVMWHNVAIPAECTNASSQYAAPNQVPGLLTQLLPQSDQWIFKLLAFSDFPLGEEDQRRLSNALPIRIRTTLAAVVLALPVKWLSAGNATGWLTVTDRYRWLLFSRHSRMLRRFSDTAQTRKGDNP